MEYLIVALCSAYDVEQKETHRRTVGVIDVRSLSEFSNLDGLPGNFWAYTLKVNFFFCQPVLVLVTVVLFSSNWIFCFLFSYFHTFQMLSTVGSA